MKPIYSLLFTTLIVAHITVRADSDSLLYSWRQMEEGVIMLSDSQQVNLLNQLASIYSRQNPDSSKMFAKLALDKMGDGLYIQDRTEAYTALAIASYVQGNGIEAYDYSLQIIALAEKSGDKQAELQGKCYLGLAYMIQDKLKPAIRIFDEYIEMAIELSDTAALTRGYLDQSINYDGLGLYDTALFYVNASIEVGEHDPESKTYVEMAYNRKAYILSALQRYEDALANHGYCLQVIAPENNWERAFAYAGMAKADAGLGRFEDSFRYGNMGLQLAMEMGAKWEIKNVSEILANAYEQSGNYQKANEYFKLYKAYHDSIFNEDNEQTIAALELRQTQIERDGLKRDHELQSKILSQRNTLLLLMALVAIVLVLLLVVLYFNYTSRKRYSEELSKQRDKLDDLNQSKDRVLSVLSHDMRSPINSILSILHLLKEERDSKEIDFQSLLDDAYERTETVSKSLNSILDWSGRQFRQEAHKPEPVKVIEVVEEQLQLCRFDLNKKYIAAYHEKANAVEVVAEREQLRSIIRNLLSNAIKFTDNYGKIKVKYRDLGEILAIDVMDSGVGMTEKVKANLFKTKGTTTLGTNNETGTGFGLFISNEYAQMNEGRLEVESTPNEGATFSLLLRKAYTD